MEFEELKNSWNAASAESEKTNINIKLINKMTQEKYRSKINQIAYPELIGTIISFIGAVYIVLHFDKLNTIFLQIVGALVIAYLIIAPIVSITMLYQFNKTIDVKRPFRETLKQFVIQKNRFYKFQQFNVFAAYVLMACFIILLPKLFTVRNFNTGSFFWGATIVGGYIFLYVFSKWVFGKYKKALLQSEGLLRDIES